MRFAGLMAGLSMSVATAVGALELAEIPSVPLEDLPREGREQFETLLAEIGAGTGDPEDRPGLARTYGELGKLAFAYDFRDTAEAAWRNAAALEDEAFEWHYYLGALYRLEGDLEAASERLQTALSIRSGDLPTLVRLARVRIEQGRLGEASELFERALASAPGSSAALYGLGRIAVDEGRYKEALEPLLEALPGQPEGTTVHHQLGLAYRGLGDLELAREHLARSQGIRVAFPDPLMERVLGLVRGAHVRARSGIQAQRSGRLDMAVRLLREAAALDPENAWIRYNLGVVYQETGNVEAAVEQYESAVRFDPAYRNAHFNLAELMAGAGDFEGAARHFRRAAEIDPADRLARLELAVALSRLGRNEEALAELESLTSRATDFVEARLALATLMSQLGRQAEAESLALGVVGGDAAAPELAQAHLLLARLREPADAATALKHYRTAVELDPGSRDAGYALAMALGRRGRFAAAAERFELLVELDPDDPALRMGQTMALLLGEDYAGARAVLESALVRLPEDVALMHSLARLLATCPDDGVRDGQRALELAQKSLERRQSLEHAETLAMALAETGRFSDAVALQAQVVEQRRLQAEPARIRLSERYLSLFEQRRPVRAPWMEGG